MCYPHDNEEQFFMLMAQPPLKSDIGQIIPREFIFIVDVSGSMYGYPLEISKRILKELLSSLRPTDIFNVMLFEFSQTMLSDKSLPATPENIKKALDIICEQSGSGGTELYSALQTAFNFRTTSDFARTFLVITDGYVSIESKAFQLVSKQRDKANLFALGIGENVNRHLIEGLAYAGAGGAYFITNETDAKRIGGEMIEEISTPVWSHIQINWGGFDVYDVEPVTLPDLFAARPLILYGKYRGKPSGKITLKGKTSSGYFEQTLSAENSEMVSSEALRYLWARNRIKYLSDYASYFEDDVQFYYKSETPNHQNEITELGLKYNLLTKYTSFLAVDDRVRIESREHAEEIHCCKSVYYSRSIPSQKRSNSKFASPVDELSFSIFAEESDNKYSIVHENASLKKEERPVACEHVVSKKNFFTRIIVFFVRLLKKLFG
jgi:Ca-activated chloride channel family protein